MGAVSRTTCTYSVVFTEVVEQAASIPVRTTAISKRKVFISQSLSLYIDDIRPIALRAAPGRARAWRPLAAAGQPRHHPGHSGCRRAAGMSLPAHRNHLLPMPPEAPGRCLHGDPP